MRTELVSILVFGSDSPLPPVYGNGWSVPESGFTWTNGHRSEIVLPVLPQADAYLIELSLSPFVTPDSYTEQKLTLEISGTEIGSITLVGRAVVAFQARGRLLESGAVLTLVQPDAVRPCDIGLGADARRLGMMTRMIRVFRILPSEHAPLPLPDDDQAMLAMCESLGDNCEFGLTQRKFGVETLGLLRFSGIPIDLLVRGIDEFFMHFADRAAIKPDGVENASTHGIYVGRYGLHHHTFIPTADMSEADMLRKQWKRLQFLARTFMQELDLARRLFVVKRNRELSLPEVLPLFAAMNRRGPCWLFWVSGADADHAPGTVETVLPGLMRGWIKGFGNYRDAMPVYPEQWLYLLREVFLTFDEKDLLDGFGKDYSDTDFLARTDGGDRDSGSLAYVT